MRLGHALRQIGRSTVLEEIVQGPDRAAETDLCGVGIHIRCGVAPAKIFAPVDIDVSGIEAQWGLPGMVENRTKRSGLRAWAV